MTRNLIETLLGAIVLVVAIGFLTFAYRSSQVGDTSGYELVAKFNRVDGLERGADVRISGIKVGTVVDQKLDPETYRAEVRFTLHDGVKLPADSSAAVVSSGLLGSKYLSLIPGGDTEMLKAGDEVTLTQSSINLEDLVGHLIFSQSGGQSSGGKARAARAGAPAGATAARTGGRRRSGGSRSGGRGPGAGEPGLGEPVTPRLAGRQPCCWRSGLRTPAPKGRTIEYKVALLQGLDKVTARVSPPAGADRRSDSFRHARDRRPRLPQDAADRAAGECGLPRDPRAAAGLGAGRAADRAVQRLDVRLEPGGLGARAPGLRRLGDRLRRTARAACGTGPRQRCGR